MQIDWITVSAQIVNFLILVWLLKRFLYQPVIRAMERREQRITKRLDEAQEREQRANKEVQDYQDKSDELERQRDRILTRAKEQAEQQKKQLLKEAREEVSKKRDNWRHQASEEKDEFLHELQQQVAGSIQSMVRKTLSDLGDTHLEEQLVLRFVERLKSLDKKARRALADSAEPASISTAFELGPALRSRLTRTIHEQVAEDIEVEYRQSPELLCGIELNHGGHRLSWNLADYMKEMETSINDTFSAIETEQQAEAK